MPNIKEFYLNSINGECIFEYDNGEIKTVKLSEVNSSVLPAVHVPSRERIANRVKGPAIVAPDWAASTVYVEDQVRKLPSGDHLVCQTGGTSGATAPTFNSARPITDNTVTWRYANISKKNSDAIVPTVTTAANSSGFTEVRFHTNGSATQFITTRNAIGVSRFDAFITAFGSAIGPSTGSGNATDEAAAAGYTGEVFGRYWPEAECYITDSHVSLTFHNVTGKVWVEIEGQLMEADATSHNGTSGGRVTWDFGVYARRHVKFLQVGDTYQLRGVALSANGRVEPAEPSTDTMLYFGDSFGNTISPSNFDMPTLSGVIRSLRRALSVSSLVDMTVGGSGYVSKNANTYNISEMLNSPNNIAFFSIYDPKHIVCAAGFNDRSNSNRALVISEAKRTWALMRTRFPSAKITIVGGWPGGHGPDADGISLNADLQVAFNEWADKNARYLNPAKSLAEAWTNGDGSTGESITGTSGTASMYTGTDTVHPSPYGGVYLGRRLADEMIAAWGGNL